MQQPSYWRRSGTLVLIALCLLLAGCSSALMDPKGVVGETQRSLILSSFGLMLIVVIPVIVMTIVFGWYYRRSNTMAEYLPDWAHSNWIEAIVWLVPVVIVAILGVITWKSSHELDPHRALESDIPELEIQVVALDWKWLFIYPEQGIATVNEVAFPVDTPVRFRVSSGSVMNSFFIPRLGSQIYAMAGMDNDVYLEANEIGTYSGRSTNYSGAGFSGMIFDAHATSDEDFDAWVEEVRQSPQTLTYPEGYSQLAERSSFNPVEYFASVTPEFYERLVSSFRTGSDPETDTQDAPRAPAIDSNEAYQTTDNQASGEAEEGQPVSNEAGE